MGQVDSARGDRSYSGADLVVATLSSFLVVTYISLGWGGGEDRFLLVGVVLFGWLVLFFTDHWEPVLYVLVAVILLSFTLVWVVEGLPPRDRTLEWVVVLLNVVFSLLAAYLFLAEERFTAR